MGKKTSKSPDKTKSLSKGPSITKARQQNGTITPKMARNIQTTSYSNQQPKTNQSVEDMEDEDDDSKRLCIDENNLNRTQQDEEELPNKVSRIPATKFSINKNNMKQFEAPALLANEIKRCKNSIKFELIKFANIKDNIVTIATDDQETYNLLNQDWKPDAFLLGIKFLRDQKPKTFTMIIKGVHESVNLSEKSVIDQLKIQGLINAKRIIRKDNTQTTLVKAVATNKEAYKAALEKKIKIFFTLHKAEPFKTITQCFKCQKVGHTHYNCSEVKNVCLKCSGNHRLNECKEKSPKCSNCNGDHVACSRLCPYLKEESKKVIHIC